MPARQQHLAQFAQRVRLVPRLQPHQQHVQTGHMRPALVCHRARRALH